MDTKEISKSTEEVKHTPLPWKLMEGAAYTNIHGPGRIQLVGIAKVAVYPEVEGLANAEFIVTACNSYYQLLKENAELKLKCVELNLKNRFWNVGKEQLIEAARYGYEYHQNTQFQQKDFDSNCKNNFLQTLKQD